MDNKRTKKEVKIAKRLQRADECRKKIQKYRERIERVEQNPDYDDRPDIKIMRVNSCLRNIQNLEMQIRSLEGPLPPRPKRKRKNSHPPCTNPTHPYSSGRGPWSRSQSTSYTHTNIGHPYPGGKCTPK